MQQDANQEAHVSNFAYFITPDPTCRSRLSSAPTERRLRTCRSSWRPFRGLDDVLVLDDLAVLQPKHVDDGRAARPWLSDGVDVRPLLSCCQSAGEADRNYVVSREAGSPKSWRASVRGDDTSVDAGKPPPDLPAAGARPCYQPSG